MHLIHAVIHQQFYPCCGKCSTVAAAAQVATAACLRRPDARSQPTEVPSLHFSLVGQARWVPEPAWMLLRCALN